MSSRLSDLMKGSLNQTQPVSDWTIMLMKAQLEVSSREGAKFRLCVYSL